MICSLLQHLCLGNSLSLLHRYNLSSGNKNRAQRELRINLNETKVTEIVRNAEYRAATVLCDCV